MLRTAVDIGGTFTDVVTFDQEAGTIAVEKTPSTPDNPAQGVINGLRKAEVDMSDVDFFSHGSTVGTNALIERELPRIGLVTTEGFRDVHEIRDSTKDHLWDAYETVAPPYVNREDRFEVSERVDYRGEVVEPLDRTQARTVAKRLRKRNIRTVAVVFVNAHMNGDHEREVAEIVRAEHPDAFVCTSNEIMAKLGEHPRTSTTVINAALVPVVREYLTDLADRLGRMGYDNNVLAMHSGGGVMTADAIAYYAARIANSGPTAGAIASTFIAEQCDFRNVIGFDMGGTSTDVSLTYRGAIEMTNEWAVESGYPINFPSTDIETIGAGGGSIAWIDRGGSLRVGPQSQGADPGPACYQRGGDRPTITDANVLLNWLSPDSFIGGDMEASSEPSREAIERKIADPLGLDPIEAAMAIEEIGLAFLFAPNFHPIMGQVLPIESQLQVKTVFYTLIGPLINPAGVTSHLLGVYEPEYVRMVGDILEKMEFEHGLVVHGLDGLDELSVTGRSSVAEVRNGAVERYEVTPEEVGLERWALEDLAGGAPEENARILRDVLSGEERGAKRDLALMNAAGALYVGGKADSLADGVERAAKSIDDGRASAQLDELVDASGEV